MNPLALTQVFVDRGNLLNRRKQKNCMYSKCTRQRILPLRLGAFKPFYPAHPCVCIVEGV
jgi:hypothetical protein